MTEQSLGLTKYLLLRFEVIDGFADSLQASTFRSATSSLLTTLKKPVHQQFVTDRNNPCGLMQDTRPLI